MIFDPPRVEKIATIELRLEDRAWSFATERAKDIDAHWAELSRANPRHYNGRVLLTRDLAVEAKGHVRKLAGTCFVAEYKAFLAWRDFDFPDGSVNNLFAMAALRSADEAFLLGEMAASTANAGKIYFPAGTPEPRDVLGGFVDLDASVLRELEEETGIGADEIAVDAGWSVVFQGARVACMRSIRSLLSAGELVRRVAAFIAAEQHPELAGLKAVFGPQDLDKERMPDFIETYIRHALRKAGTKR